MKATTTTPGQFNVDAGKPNVDEESDDDVFYDAMTSIPGSDDEEDTFESDIEDDKVPLV